MLLVEPPVELVSLASPDAIQGELKVICMEAEASVFVELTILTVRLVLPPGDKVAVELSPYDLTRGRISFRHLDAPSAGAPRAPNRKRY